MAIDRTMLYDFIRARPLAVLLAPTAMLSVLLAFALVPSASDDVACAFAP